jgi:Class III cytochrome C family.
MTQPFAPDQEGYGDDPARGRPVRFRSAHGPVKAGTEPSLINAVPFNHKLHEEKNENCSVCHHNSSTKGVIPCSQCHTSLGKEEGAFITTEQAMHRVTSRLLA